MANKFEDCEQVRGLRTSSRTANKFEDCERFRGVCVFACLRAVAFTWCCVAVLARPDLLPPVPPPYPVRFHGGVPSWQSARTAVPQRQSAQTQ
eukprot:gene17058-biopygen2102